MLDTNAAIISGIQALWKEAQDFDYETKESRQLYGTQFPMQVKFGYEVMRLLERNSLLDGPKQMRFTG